MINKVLIVEDDSEVQDLLVNYLQLYGLKENKILMASDPVEGLEIFKNEKNLISLVICDYYMPKSNGAELCEIIKRNQPHTPILLQTGDLNINKKSLKSVDSILHKPYEYETFVNIIEDLCTEPPEFTFLEQEKRILNIDNEGMSVKFLSSNKFSHGLVLNRSENGCKIAMKPTTDIKEKAILETRTTTYCFNDNSSKVDDMLKYEVVWFQLLDLDICIVGLKLIL